MSDQLQPEIMPVSFDIDEEGVYVTYLPRRKQTLHVKDVIRRTIDPSHPLIEPLVADLIDGLRELIETAESVQLGTPERIPSARES